MQDPHDDLTTLFHRLWTKAVSTKNYDKREWMTLEKRIFGCDAILSGLVPENRIYFLSIIKDENGNDRLSASVILNVNLKVGK